jgi:hypothetical protein
MVIALQRSHEAPLFEDTRRVTRSKQNTFVEFEAKLLKEKITRNTMKDYAEVKVVV